MRLREIERYWIERTFAETGSRRETAKQLGIGTRTLQYKLRQYGYEPREQPRTAVLTERPPWEQR